MLASLIVRLAGLGAAVLVGGIVLLAGGPDWAVAGFGCQTALIVYMSLVACR